MSSPADPEIEDPQPDAGAGPLDLFTTLARTGLFLEALQRECLSDHALTFTEFSVIRLLQRSPSKHNTPSALAREIVCTTGAMTKLIDRLQRNGLVDRAPDPADRRGVLIRLTSNGNRTANRASASYRAGRQRVLDRVPAEDAHRIQASLERLLIALEVDRENR